MKLIRLSGGQFTQVNNDVYRWARLFRWTSDKRKHTCYAYRKVAGVTRHLHQFILDTKPGEEVHHKDGNGLHNLRRNIVKVTHTVNQRGRIAKNSDTSSRYRGVAWHSRDQRWRAHIKVNQQQIWLGYFDSEKAAARARDKAAKRYFGKMAGTNFS